MDHDRIAVRDLSFVFEMRSLNALPTISAVRAAKHAQQKILVAAGLIFREGIEHIRIRRTNGQTRAAKVSRFRQTFLQMLPLLSAVSGSPNAAARSLLGEGRIDPAFGCRVKDDRVTPVVLARNKRLPFPGDARIGRNKHSAKVFSV